MTANTVYFAQHGLAIDKMEDASRPLSQTGIEQTQSVAKQLHTSRIPVSCICHSGKLRASQTAEIFALNLKITSVSEHTQLSPNDDVKLLANNLTVDNALYIGHLPHLEKLVSHLVSGDADHNIIKFKNSAIVCLQKYNNNHQILWYLTPELLVIQNEIPN